MFPITDVIPSRTFPVVTIALIVVNAMIFVVELKLGEQALQQFVQSYAVIPASFAWPSLLTGMFLHGGWLHLAGNMLYLWIFGDNVEDRFGHVPFLLFYVGCGTLAALGHLVTNPHSTIPLVGASGAVAGVMGAYLVLYPQSRVLALVLLVVFFDLVEIPAVFLLGLWFVLQLFSGVGSIGTQAAAGGVAFWAHVIGFAIGAGCGAVQRRIDASRQRDWQY